MDLLRPTNEHPASGVRFSSVLLSDDGGVQISYSLPEERGQAGIVEYRTLVLHADDLPLGVFTDFIEYVHLFYDQIMRIRAGRYEEVVERAPVEDADPDVNVEIIQR